MYLSIYLSIHTYIFTRSQNFSSLHVVQASAVAFAKHEVAQAVSIKPKERIPEGGQDQLYTGGGSSEYRRGGVSCGFAFAKHDVAQAVSIKPKEIIPGGGSGPYMLNEYAESRTHSVFYACLACFMNAFAKHDIAQAVSTKPKEIISEGWPRPVVYRRGIKGKRVIVGGYRGASPLPSTTSRRQ